MGGQANTNSTFGSSNFSGSIQSTVSAGITQGMSIVSYTGTGSVGTFGHGLNAKLNLMIQKKRSGSAAWTVYHDKVATDPATDYLYLSSTAAVADYADHFNDTEPTSSVFTLGTDTSINGSSATNIMFCFTEKKSYSKFGSYEGNGNTDGTFVYTGFKPAFIILKNTSNAQNWYMYDNKRTPNNFANYHFYADLNNAEAGGSTLGIDILSNGWKIKTSNDGWNGSGENYIYMAFAESPFVNSKGVPTNAR